MDSRLSNPLPVPLRTPMAQSPRERAVARLEEISEEARKLRLFIEIYDQLDIGNDSPAAQVYRAAAAASIREDERFATKEEIYQAVQEILHGETEPMHIGHLYKLVTSRGLRISGQNPKGNLSAKLAPCKDVVYVKDQGWILEKI